MTLNGNVKRGAYIAVPTALVISLCVAAYANIIGQVNAARDAAVSAIAVAKDHGEELKLLRKDYTLLRGELHMIQQQIQAQTNDRFRGADADKMEARIVERIRSVEKRVEAHNH